MKIVVDEWEKFTGGALARSGERLSVTVNPKGVLYLSTAVFKMMGKPEGVQMFFNSKRNMIGLKPSSPRLGDAFPVRGKPDGTSHVIHASPFLRHNGISTATTERFVEPEMDDNGEMLVLDLTRTVTVRGSTRSKKVLR